MKFSSALILSVLSSSAFAASQPAAKPSVVCSAYNNYVGSQCVSKRQLAKEADAEILKGYSKKSCKSEALLTILETDEVARGLCAPVVANEQIESLQARAAD